MFGHLLLNQGLARLASMMIILQYYVTGKTKFYPKTRVLDIVLRRSGSNLIRSANNKWSFESYF